MLVLLQGSSTKLLLQHTAAVGGPPPTSRFYSTPPTQSRIKESLAATRHKQPRPGREPKFARRVSSDESADKCKTTHKFELEMSWLPPEPRNRRRVRGVGENNPVLVEEYFIDFTHV